MSVCYDDNGIPVPCGGWNVYDSYVTDPRYQRYFTIAWTTILALAFFLTTPAIVRILATGDWRRTLGSLAGLFGVHEGARRGYTPVRSNNDKTHSATALRRPPGVVRRPFLAVAALVQSASLLNLPLPASLSRLPRIPFLHTRRAASCHPTKTYLPFSLGRLAVALLIPAFLLATLLPESQLRANPNRFGFLAITCLPPLCVLAAKNGPTSWLLGRGWTAVNFLHRWLGRAIVLLVLLHFYFWTIQYSGAAQTAFLAGEKERRGIAALAFLLLITLSSLPPMRRFSYPVFFVLHYVGIVGFLAFLHKHTTHARAYSTWPIIAIYTADILGRVLSMRIRVVEAEALDGGMVRLALPGLRAGWRGGQHLSIRVFFVPPPLVHARGTGRLARVAKDAAHALRSAVRPFEAHPLSIATEPTGLAADGTGLERGIELYARSCGAGTWTDDLHRFVVASEAISAARRPTPKKRKTRMLCLLEGPYGGLPAYSSPLTLLEDTESLLLVAGGSGMSFVLGVLDEVVGRRLGAQKRGRVDVVWVVRQRTHVAWFGERLRAVLGAAEGSTVRVVLREVAAEDAVPVLSRTQARGGCCAGVRGAAASKEDDGDHDDIAELPPAAAAIPSSCCGPSSSGPAPAAPSCGGCCARTTGGGCCTGATEGSPSGTDADADERDRRAGKPLRVRTGGLGVVVCGPGNMVAELCNAVAAIPVAKQVRVGGVSVHVEQYSV
ncbi:putative ferric reductase transmembrane component [Rhodotorula diobovata]|uniref:Putative ferric reductase transmembrane component n=1 Tax=Rhodotorula diobovata TaxID=5288 RepID=A0A5C5FN08_9BASI|nr:putative ferric reductase transmembrane component [Rhodotorula diobovata]